MSGTTDPTQQLSQHFASALRQKAGLEVVEANVSEKSARFLGRLPKERQGDWLLVMHQMLKNGEGREWKIDISKHYFLRSGRLVYAWRLILQGAAAKQMLEEALNAVSAAPQTSRAEIMSAPLVGASIYRTQEIDGKGVGATGMGGGVPAIVRMVANRGRV